MIDLRAIGLVVALSFIPLTAVGHHGVSGQFDTRKSIEISGKITRVKLVNPHSYVYLDVKNADGKVTNMRCEMTSGSILKRRGWSKDMFPIGSEITITGSPDRDDQTTCHMDEIIFANGMVANRRSSFADDGTVKAEKRKIVRANGVPNIEGNWAMMGRESRRGGGPNVSLTPAGAAVVADATPEQNPRFNCQVTNIVMDWWFNQMVNSISQSDTEITLTYGFMDLERTIYLDGRDMPADFTPSRSGFSTGEWDGNTLIVTTTGFDEGWIGAPIGGRRSSAPTRGNQTREQGNRPERPRRAEGSERPPRPEGGRRGPQPVKNSLELTVMEEFTLNDEGTMLTRHYKFIDPLYLKAPIEGSDTVSLTTDSYESYDCDDLTNERAE